MHGLHTLSYIVGQVEGERRQLYGATNHTHAYHTADSLADNLGFNSIPKLNQRKRPGVRGQIRVADAGFAAFPRAAATGTRLGWLRAMRRGGVSSSSEADRLPLRCIICLRIPEGSCQGTGVGSTARAPRWQVRRVRPCVHCDRHFAASGAGSRRYGRGSSRRSMPRRGRGDGDRTRRRS